MLEFTLHKLCLQVGPICLPCTLRNANFSGTTVTASGWGTEEEGNNDTPDRLRKVDLTVLTTEECRKYYGSQITNNMICTYKAGKDTCQGDSGIHIYFVTPASCRTNSRTDFFIDDGDCNTFQVAALTWLPAEDTRPSESYLGVLDALDKTDLVYTPRSVTISTGLSQQLVRHSTTSDKIRSVFQSAE